LVIQDSWGLGVGLTTPPCKTIIVATPSKEPRIDGFFVGRPKPTPGCSAEEEEEEYQIGNDWRVQEFFLFVISDGLVSLACYGSKLILDPGTL
jgi:hypothetical protein